MIKKFKNQLMILIGVLLLLPVLIIGAMLYMVNHTKPVVFEEQRETLTLAVEELSKTVPPDVSGLINKQTIANKPRPEQIAETVQFTFIPGEGLPEVNMDPDQVEQVLMNIIYNAVQAMPGGGEVRISTGHDVEEKMVTIDIKDSGCGVPEELLDKLFDPFFSTRANGGFSGRFAKGKAVMQLHHGLSG